jgi:hypothetical protein
MKHDHPTLELPVGKLDRDPDSGHHGFGTDEEERHLRSSIQMFGVMSALQVCEDGHGRYIIIDGQRRHLVARELGLRNLWCVVHPQMDRGKREALRFILYSTSKPLTKTERLRELRKMRALGVSPWDDEDLEAKRRA